MNRLALGVAAGVLAGCTALLGISEPSGDGVASDAGALDAGPSFSVAFDPPVARAVRGQSAFRTVRATRQPGFTGAIEVSLTGLPGGVTGTMVTIAAGMDTGNMQLSAESGAVLGPAGAMLHAVAGAEQHDFPAALMIGDAPGALDLSFAEGTGVYTAAPSALPGAARALALQSDGKIIVVGDGGVILRLATDGTVDTSFGTSGSIDTDDDSIIAVAIGDDDIIYTCGNHAAPLQIRVRKLDADGAAIDGFGVAGVTAFPDQNGFAVAVDAFGNVLVAASDSSGNSMTIQRLMPSGLPDTSFAGTGVFHAPAFLFGMSARPDLSFVGTGNIGAMGETGAYLVSAGADGFPEPGFGGDGQIALGALGDIGYAVALGPDGSAVITGVANFGISTVQVLAGRVLADGSVDANFGVDGVVRRDFGGPGAEGYGLALQADGKIVIGVTGNQAGSPTVGGVMRLFANGSPDPSFAGGAATVVVPGATAAASISVLGIVLQPDGRIITAGGCSETGWVVARLWD